MGHLVINYYDQLTDIAIQYIHWWTWMDDPPIHPVVAGSHILFWPILHLWGCYNKSHYKIGTSWIDPNMFGSSVNECPRVRLQHPQLIPGVWFLNDTYTYGTVDTYGFVGPADFVPWKHSCKLGQNPCDPHRHRWRWFAWFYEDLKMVQSLCAASWRGPCWADAIGSIA